MIDHMIFPVLVPLIDGCEDDLAYPVIPRVSRSVPAVAGDAPPPNLHLGELTVRQSDCSEFTGLQVRLCELPSRGRFSTMDSQGTYQFQFRPSGNKGTQLRISALGMAGRQNRRGDVLRTRAPGLSFELDGYWVQYGGMSPNRWISELGDKLVSFHLKDFGVASKHGEPPIVTEVGQGNLDFHALVSHAEDVGCQWFIVEQDVTPGNPFDSLERSFRYVRKELVAPETA